MCATGCASAVWGIILDANGKACAAARFVRGANNDLANSYSTGQFFAEHSIAFLFVKLAAVANEFDQVR